MNPPIKRLTVIEYSDAGDAFEPQRTLDPAWPVVESAIRRQERNVLTDIEKVLRIVRRHVDTGSCAGLDRVA